MTAPLGTLPKDLTKEFGAFGLEGYGCAGTNAVSYGLACLELEAGDSGLRSFVSVQTQRVSPPTSSTRSCHCEPR